MLVGHLHGPFHLYFCFCPWLCRHHPSPAPCCLPSNEGGLDGGHAVGVTLWPMIRKRHQPQPIISLLRPKVHIRLLACPAPRWKQTNQDRPFFLSQEILSFGHLGLLQSRLNAHEVPSKRNAPPASHPSLHWPLPELWAAMVQKEAEVVMQPRRANV